MSYNTLTSDLARQEGGKNAVRSPLLQLFWHRVVLDEVQYVEGAGAAAKGKAGAAGGGAAGGGKGIDKRARMAFELQAAHRWAVSGTPLEAADDLQAVLKFLRHQPFESTVSRGVGLVCSLTQLRRPRLLSSSAYYFPLPLHVPSSLPLPQVWWESALRPALTADSSEGSLAHAALELAAELAKRDAAIDVLMRSGQTGWRQSAFFPCGPYRAGYFFRRGADLKWSNKKIQTLAREVRDYLPAPMLARQEGDWRASDLNADAIVREVTAAQRAAVSKSPVVRRFGTGLQLLSLMLRPILWRNTQARVRALGQLTLPPVTELVVSIRLSSGEEAVYREMLKVRTRTC